jgi:hypothetical protein
MIEQEVVDQALALICDKGGVSFVELRRLLGEDRARGDLAVEFPGMPNVVLWAGMSQDFVDLVDAITKSGRAVITPTTVLVYLADGVTPNFPLAKRLPRGGYKQPHWTPVTFNRKQGAA